jgi:hypothetical protein
VSQQINLYNPIFRKQEKHFSARTMMHSLGVIALGLCVFYTFAMVQTRTAERASRESAEQLNSQRGQLVALAAKLAPQGRSAALEAEVNRMEADVRSRQALLGVLSTGELGNTAGFSEFLAAFGRQALPGVWLTALNIGEAGNDLQVEGRVLRPELVPAYLRALNSEPMMRGRRVAEMKLSSKSTPAAGRPGPAKGPTQEPERFVEFILAVPRTIAESSPAAKAAPAPVAKGAKK